MRIDSMGWFHQLVLLSLTLCRHCVFCKAASAGGLRPSLSRRSSVLFCVSMGTGFVSPLFSWFSSRIRKIKLQKRRREGFLFLFIGTLTDFNLLAGIADVIVSHVYGYDWLQY
ncbi:hypothetical protein V6N13_050497 [Hibiscus sabdariffa]